MLRTKSSKDAMTLLKRDHDAVKELFDRFEDASESENPAERKSVVDEACRELKVHAAIEEEMFYPALRQHMEDEDGLLDEADEEHHEIKILVAELALMTGEEENYCAKFELLSENVRYHVKEEENGIFPRAKKTAIDFDALGERMWQRRQELMAEGVPPDVEAEMVGMFGVIKESPAKKAQKTFMAPMSDAKGRARKH